MHMYMYMCACACKTRAVRPQPTSVSWDPTVILGPSYGFTRAELAGEGAKEQRLVTKGWPRSAEGATTIVRTVDEAQAYARPPGGGRVRVQPAMQPASVDKGHIVLRKQRARPESDVGSVDVDGRRTKRASGRRQNAREEGGDHDARPRREHTDLHVRADVGNEAAAAMPCQVDERCRDLQRVLPEPDSRGAPARRVDLKAGCAAVQPRSTVIGH